MNMRKDKRRIGDKGTGFVYRETGQRLDGRGLGITGILETTTFQVAFFFCPGNTQRIDI
jgi:hypothetical protein